MLPVEPGQRQSCNLWLAGPARLKVWAERGDEQYWPAFDLLDQQIQQFSRTGVEPMKILEQKYYRLLAREAFDLAQPCLERLFLLALWRHLEQWIAGGARERQQLGEKRQLFIRRRGRRQ